MDLQIANQLFLICGATSGFGNAVVRTLCGEQANVIGVGRRAEELGKLEDEYPRQFTGISGDLREANTLSAMEDAVRDRHMHGILLNSAGPPTMAALETSPADWDEAYRLLFRWKVDLLRRLMPRFLEQKYGRILFLESQSVKQPIENLVLSTAMRAAVTGYAKTLSREVAGQGITVNVLAPGSHDTPAIERIIENISRNQKISREEARKVLENRIPAKRLGEAREFAALAVFLLSGHAGFITGQTVSHDGGSVQGLFG